MKSIFKRSLLAASATLFFCVPGYSSTPDLTELLTPNELADEFGILPGAGQDIQVLKSARMQITVHKAASNETLDVTIDGKQVESWPTSTGREQWETSPSGHHYFTRTPDGRFRIIKMVADYHSQMWNNAEMNDALFFNGGIAIHGIDPALESKLGTPASGGCVRLSQENAKTLWAQVMSVGQRNVLIIVTSDTTAPQPQPSASPQPSPVPQPSASPTPGVANWP